MELGEVAKSGLWLYIGRFTSNVTGYVFWVLATFFVGPDTIGIASAVVALQSLLITVASLGQETGLRGFVGKGAGLDDANYISRHFSGSLIIATSVNLLVAAFLILASIFHLPVFGLSSNELMLSAALMVVSFVIPVFFAFFNSLLRTDITAKAHIMSSIFKIGTGILLLYLGFDLLALILGYFFASIIADFILIFSARNIFGSIGVGFQFNKTIFVQLLKSGFPAWIPNTLIVAGRSLGVLIAFSYIGSLGTGLYYVAFAIASVVSSIPISIQSLLFPILSGMEEGKIDTVRRVTSFSIAITTPLALLVSVYSELPLILLSTAFLDAAPILSILVLGAILDPIYAGYYSYMYSIEKYRHVLGLGMALNISRIILYTVLPVFAGVLGIAFSFVFGLLVALLAVRVSAMITNTRLNWEAYAKAIVIPCCFALPVYMLHIAWMLGIPMLLFASFIAYARFGVITRADLSSISRSFLSEKRMYQVNEFLRPLLDFLFRE